MIRNAALNVRLNANERQLAEAVAERLERTESDMVRLLLREKARQLGIIPTTNDDRRPQQVGVIST
jgi:antitoxin component of RelBE/YafQ-DinJ toxin-antitoxin module